MQFVSLQKHRETCQHHVSVVCSKNCCHISRITIGFDLLLEIGKLKIHHVTLAKQAGISDVEEKNVELLECHDKNMSTDELKQLHKELGLIKTDDDEEDNNDEEKPVCELAKNILQNSLAKTEGLQEHENNYIERSEKVLRTVKQDLACYY
jgi:hypothetical protein